MLGITALIENVSPSPGLHAEHGLSLHVRHGGKSYLIDTGAGAKFIENARKLGVDLSGLDAVIITHNHNDHIGGLPPLLELNKNVKVYIKKAAETGQFYNRVMFFHMNIANRPGLFEKYRGRFVFFDGEADISPSFHLLSNTVRDAEYFCKDGQLEEKRNGKYIPDRFEHELFAVAEERGKLVILSSCSHSGIVNIVNTVRGRFPGKEISHIVGGFHLMGFGRKPLNCEESYVAEVTGILQNACTDAIYTCHCTGKTAYEIMRAATNGKVRYLETGGNITV